jgi:DNA-binding transcriptional LysR family regulator
MQDSSFPNLVNFGLSSEQCELLLAFEMSGSLSELSTLVRRDVSVVSRALTRIAQTAPVLEKNQGKWRLSSVGREVTKWTREAAAAQKQILSARPVIKIASTREFAARILAPRLGELMAGAEDANFSIITSISGVEQPLLSGEADIGFDCGRPEDSGVRFRTVQPESFVVIASPRFLKEHRITSHKELLATPHLQYKRALTPRVLQLCYEVPHVRGVFNDIAVLRGACVAGLGWAVLPAYTVRTEVEEGLLKTVPGWKIEDEQFGVWWLRGRTTLEPWIERAVAWLKKQKLSL